LSDDGGVGTMSSSVRRARSRRGTLAGGVAERADFRAGARLRAFMALIGLFFFGFWRLAKRRLVARFFTFRADFLGLLAFRLAMAPVLSNLDSLPISVVLSVAYRNLQKPSGAPAPAFPISRESPEVGQTIVTGGRARHGER
jgi:hypothetical protein